jgi:hypothetical protein
MTMNPRPAGLAHETMNPAILAEAAAAMDSVLDQQPDLGDFGFGVHDLRRKSNTQYVEELQQERNDIRKPFALASFVKTREWLSRHGKLKKVNKSGSSYGLKHVVENDIGYITNGVFIAAAIAEGFRVVRIEDSPNAWLNISSTAWKSPGRSPLLR